MAWIRRMVVVVAVVTALAGPAGGAPLSAQAMAPPPTPTGVTARADDEGVWVSWYVAEPWADQPDITVTPYVGQTALPSVRGESVGFTLVRGLTNGTAYRFTVTASNDDGSSAPSAKTPAVRPERWRPFATPDRLIRRMHRLFAFRAPTTDELATWRDGLTGATATRTDLVLALIDGPAWDDTVGALIRYYFAAVSRPPDIEGLRYWRDELLSGRRTLNAVARLIGDSAEARERRAVDGDAADIIRGYYLSAFNRLPSAAETQYWVDRLAAGTPYWKIALLFTEAAERGDPLHLRYYSLFIGFQDRVPDGNQSNSDLRKLGDGEITLADLVRDHLPSTLD